MLFSFFLDAIDVISILYIKYPILFDFIFSIVSLGSIISIGQIFRSYGASRLGKILAAIVVCLVLYITIPQFKNQLEGVYCAVFSCPPEVAKLDPELIKMKQAIDDLKSMLAAKNKTANQNSPEIDALKRRLSELEKKYGRTTNAPTGNTDGNYSGIAPRSNEGPTKSPITDPAGLPENKRCTTALGDVYCDN